MEDPKFSFDVLNNYIQNNDLDKVEETLNGIIKNPKTVSCDITSGIESLLRSEQQIQVLTAKTVAELAKHNEQRKYFANKNSIEDLLTLLNRAIDKNETLLAIHLCRALGNICFDNDFARNILLELNVLNTFDKLLNEIVKSDTEEYQQFRTVTCGFLLNFIMDVEDIIKKTWDAEFLKKLELITRKEKGKINIKSDCLMHLLIILGLYSDNITNCTFTILLNKDIVDMLKISEDLDISEMCLQLIHQQCENDTLKFEFAKFELCEILYTLLEKHISLASDSRVRSLVQQACEIIVIVLTGDEAMHYLYNKEGFVDSMVNWLSNSDTDFLVTGVLAIGNFARTEQHCIDMAENGIMDKLINILKVHKFEADDIRLQHALLSALRNLAIPQQNKSKLIDSGLVQVIVPMLQNDHPSLVYKLLGTLRMLTDNQEKVAIELMQNKELIAQLTHWALKSEHPGVTGESPRLMAWLIKHCCKSKNVSDDTRKAMACFIEVEGSVECLLNMFSSTHQVMQNEGLLAITIIVITFSDKSFINEDKTNIKNTLEKVLIKLDIASKLNTFLKNTKEENKELVDNALVLLQFLIKLEEIKKELRKTDLNVYLQGLQSKEVVSDKTKLIENILSNLNFQ